jgi:aspartokinase
MEPAIDSKIPIFIRNTFEPQLAGTRIYLPSTKVRQYAQGRLYMLCMRSVELKFTLLASIFNRFPFLLHVSVGLRL